MKYINQLLSLSLAIALFSCSGARVSTDKTADVDLSKYNTFAFLPMLGDSTNPSAYNYEAESQFTEQIGEEMKQLGYSIDVDNPDLLVYAQAQFQQEEELDADPIYNTYNYYTPGYAPAFNYPYYYSGYTGVNNVVGYDIDEVEFGEGSMVVDLIDAQTNEIVWRGVATDDAFSVSAAKDNVSAYADEIFEEYPAEAGS
jgi:hypothetical protein